MKTLCLIGMLTLTICSQAQWTPTNGPYGGSVVSIAYNEPYLFACNDIGYVTRSTDFGESWSIGSRLIYATSIVTTASLVFAAVFADEAGLYRSSDAGITWERISSSSMGNGDPSTVYIYRGMLFTSTYKVHRSTDFGNTWEDGEQLLQVRKFEARDTMLFAVAEQGLFRSSDMGVYWQKVSGELDTVIFTSVAVSGTTVIASSEIGLLRSVDDGKSWAGVDTSLKDVEHVIVHRGAFYAASKREIYKSTDDGMTWKSLGLNFPPGLIKTIASCVHLYIGISSYGVMRSTDDGRTWSLNNVGMNFLTPLRLSSYDNTLFAGTQAGLFRTSDRGNRWQTSIDTNLLYIHDSGRNLIAGGSYGIYYSADKGVSWNESSVSCWRKFCTRYFFNITNIDSALYVGTGLGVFRSFDHGVNWVSTDTNFKQETRDILALNDTLIAGTYDGIYVSADSGHSWSPSGLQSKRIKKLALMTDMSGNRILLAGGAYGVYRSEDVGRTWVNSISGLESRPWVEDLIVLGDYVLAGTEFGVYFSSDRGMSWNDFNEGLTLPFSDPLTYVFSLISDGVYLYAGTWSGSVWKRPLSDLLLSTESPAKPLVISLAQNYPNPFGTGAGNRATMITFNQPRSGFVSLKVYDLYGREIAALANERFEAGTHTIRFDSGGLPTGIYHYRLTIDGQTATRKMIVMN